MDFTCVDDSKGKLTDTTKHVCKRCLKSVMDKRANTSVSHCSATVIVKPRPLCLQAVRKQREADRHAAPLGKHLGNTLTSVQQNNKKYDLKFKLSVIKYTEENSGEAAARRFSVDPKRGRDGRKNQTELQRLSEEDSNRARLPGGGRKKASEEPEINMRG